MDVDDVDYIKYTPDEISRMEESLRIREASEPIELIKVVKNLTTTLAEQRRKPDLPLYLKQLIRHEILQQLRSLPENASLTEQRALLATALQSKWSMVMEEIGLWIPPIVINKEHMDKPSDVDELEDYYPLPGKPVPSECHAELHTDYGGAAVRWGLTHHKESAADCCQACLDQAKRAKPGEMKCNIWVYCPSEMGCYSPDIYEHKNQECWLKYAEQPKGNFKDKYTESYRSTHPTAPLVVPWVSGVIS
ncbi:hypothetical protein KSS87_000782 [Heliosperma pusillum]|nr:hypothetical protein KSS87_000782 [Heliosperma pusillum]